ncbi:TetR family transcriptional regulator [Nocardia puris]|uniref:TetR family transcriptional regulator n=2 Tax=Nocardia puris TaxID=208602 RepID=A0A366E4J3_9NOCA|nr:TetR family transcriptional regulator [Nocardia puris]
MTERKSTRERMVTAAVEVLRERGAGGVTIDAVLARSGAPRGSVYHHFPGGRAQLLTEALRFAGDAIGTIIDSASARGYRGALADFTDLWRTILRDSDFTAGCPVVAVAVGPADDDPELFAHAEALFARWHAALTGAFDAEGLAPAVSARLATMSLAAIEGATVLCRAQRSTAPLDQVAEQLELLV